MSTIFLFKFPEYIELVKWQDQTPNINWPMNKYNVKIYKGVSNKIDFVIRNNDRKPVSLVGYQLTAQIQRIDSPESNDGYLPELLLTKACYITDEVNGKAKLELTPEEINKWPVGSYRYVINITNANGYTEYLYTDINRSAYGTFDLFEGVLKNLVPSIEIYDFQFTPVPINEFYGTAFVSGPVPGDAQNGHTSGTNTIAVYQNNFSGKFWIQGSLVDYAPQEADWFDITLSPEYPYYTFVGKPLTHPRLSQTFEYDTGVYDYDHNLYQYKTEQVDHHGYNGLERNNIEHVCDPPVLFNFSLNLFWMRFRYIPDDYNNGKFIKILIKS